MKKPAPMALILLLAPILLLTACASKARPLSPSPQEPEAPTALIFTNDTRDLDPVILEVGDVLLGWTAEYLAERWDDEGDLLLLEARFSGLVEVEGLVEQVLDNQELRGVTYLLPDWDQNGLLPCPPQYTQMVWLRLEDPHHLLEDTGGFFCGKLLLDNYHILLQDGEGVFTATLADLLWAE